MTLLKKSDSSKSGGKTTGKKATVSRKKPQKVKKGLLADRTATIKWTTVGTAGAEIDREAYKGKKSLEYVKISDGVTEIGSSAFEGCINLKAVKIPKSVTRISREAFSRCAKLEHVELSEGVEVIDSYAFAGCKSLMEIAIPVSVKIIRNDAFVACLGLKCISLNSADTRIEADSFKQCVLLRKVVVPLGLNDNCALLSSQGYKAVKFVSDRNAKFGENVELKTAELRLWSYSPTIGTAWADSLDEVNDDLADCARDEGGGWGALDVSDIGGELKINGEAADLDFEHVRRVEDGVENTWSDFRDKIGIYSVDIDKADCSAIFAVAGDFYPKKLTLYYRTAIGPGYYKHPEDVTIDLLDRVEYDGVELELDYGDERDNKGCMFTVFNEGQYAEYDYGCDVSSLTWENLPESLHIDFRNWNDWGERKWLDYEHKLALSDELINKQFDEQWWNALEDCDSFDQIDFLSYACKRNVCWAILISWEWGCVISDNPDMASNPIVNEKIVKWCDECDESNGYYEDDDSCSDGGEGTVNRWACVLLVCPQLASQCTTYQKFNGYSQCVLLAKQPQFADKFSLAELGDPNGKCWSNCDSDDYEGAWESLIEAQPQFAKYRKG